jgi:hypothetical protein
MPTPQPEQKRSVELKLRPKHEQYLDAFAHFQFLGPKHIQYLYGRSLNDRTLRFDLMKLVTAGYLRRIRSSRDEEYTYFPAAIRERSPLMLAHTNEVTWAQVLVASGTAKRGLRLLACERHAARIKFAVSMQSDEGLMKRRSCVPDFFCAHRDPTKPAGSDARRATGTPGLGAHLPGEAATGQEMAPKPRQNSKQAYFVGCYAWLLKIPRVRARFFWDPT